MQGILCYRIAYTLYVCGVRFQTRFDYGLYALGSGDGRSQNGMVRTSEKISTRTTIVA